jgi:GTPase Era involved in 16S rRNA processing
VNTTAVEMALGTGGVHFIVAPITGDAGNSPDEIGAAARRELELELGGQVHLDLTVRVRRRWRRDEGLLDRLGID